MGLPTQAEARALLADLIPNYYIIENQHRVRYQPTGQHNDLRREAPWGTQGPIPQGQLHSYEAPHTRSLIAAGEYIITRDGPGSYHGLAGDDHPRDVLPMAPVLAETWHCIDSNPWGIGWSCVMYAHTWRSLPATSRDNLVKSIAYGFYLSSLELIALGSEPIPPKIITRDEAMRGVWGFNMHRHMDPERRTDIANPESDFPWDVFFDEYTSLLYGGTITTEEEDWFEMKTDEEIVALVAEGTRKGLIEARDSDGDRNPHDMHNDIRKFTAETRSLVRQIAARQGFEIDEKAIIQGVLAGLSAENIAANIAALGDGLAAEVAAQLQITTKEEGS